MKSKNINITPSGWVVLEYLARYRFLTVGHFQQIGLMNGDRSNIHKTLKSLKQLEKPLVGSLAFPVIPKRGRFEDFHFLTFKAWEFLQAQSQFEQIKFVAKPSSFHNDYSHRKHTMTACLSIELWCKTMGYDFSQLSTYADQQDKNARHKFKPGTYISYSEEEGIAPDALFVMRKLDEGGDIKTTAYSLELYNGLDVIRTFDQIRKHSFLLESGAVSDYFGVHTAAPVLLIFEQKRLLERVFEKISTTDYLQLMRPYFWMIELDVLSNPSLPMVWIDGTGELRTL